MQRSTWSEGRGLFVMRVALAPRACCSRWSSLSLLLQGFVNREPAFEGNVLVQIDGDMPEDEADQYDEALQET